MDGSKTRSWCLRRRGASNLARQGFVVFSYDMVGYNDTDQFPHGDRGPRLGGSRERARGREVPRERGGPGGIRIDEGRDASDPTGLEGSQRSEVEALDHGAAADDGKGERCGIRAVVPVGSPRHQATPSPRVEVHRRRG